MVIDLYEKSVQLLEKVANSVHDRHPNNTNILFFSSVEVQVVKLWLSEFEKEAKA